jgi:hypothetical protein
MAVVSDASMVRMAMTKGVCGEMMADYRAGNGEAGSRPSSISVHQNPACSSILGALFEFYRLQAVSCMLRLVLPSIGKPS